MIMQATLAVTVAALTYAACPPGPEGSPYAEYGERLDLLWERGPLPLAEAIEAERKRTGQIDDSNGEAGGAVAGGGDGDPAVMGLWDTPRDWDTIAIHGALLPTGEVLHYSYPDGGAGSRAMTWDPIADTFTDVEMPSDIFCSGLSLLPDGKVFVTGGNDYECTFQGRRDNWTFDPFSRTWEQLPDMFEGRWYPANIALGDGRVLILSGLNRQCVNNPLMEMYTPGEGLSLVKEGFREVSLFPSLHLLSDGRIAHVVPEQETYVFELGVGWQFVAINNFAWRCSGTSVLLPGRTDEIMILGGNCPINMSNRAEIIDFKDPNPSYQFAAEMLFARAHADVVILPDKTVLVVGGGTVETYGSPVNIPELYDPATNTWAPMDKHMFGRMYHATSILLPDGRVIVAGQDSGESAYRMEMFNPPYLFRGARPEITLAPKSIGYGKQFMIESPQAGDIESVGLIAPTTVTHSVNTGQRYVEIDFSVNGAQIVATGPPNGNHAPPGYYMLFIVNTDGVPSIAPFVQVGEGGDELLGDLDGDGVVNPVDLLLLLGAWGPCGNCNACHADLDDDCVVGTPDLLILLGNWS